MELKLSKKTTVRELKKQFVGYFPYLGIEFFVYKHKKGESSRMEEKVHDGLYLSEVTGELKEGIFYFEPDTAVATFEQNLQNNYGLPVQVFRRSGDVWIETINTDNLGLEKQNAMGEASIKRFTFNMNTLFL